MAVVPLTASRAPSCRIPDDAPACRVIGAEVAIKAAGEDNAGDRGDCRIVVTPKWKGRRKVNDHSRQSISMMVKLGACSYSLPLFAMVR